MPEELSLVRVLLIAASRSKLICAVTLLDSMPSATVLLTVLTMASPVVAAAMTITVIIAVKSDFYFPRTASCIAFLIILRCQTDSK